MNTEINREVKCITTVIDTMGNSIKDVINLLEETIGNLKNLDSRITVRDISLHFDYEEMALSISIYYL